MDNEESVISVSTKIDWTTTKRKLWNDSKRAVLAIWRANRPRTQNTCSVSSDRKRRKRKWNVASTFDTDNEPSWSLMIWFTHQFLEKGGMVWCIVCGLELIFGEWELRWCQKNRKQFFCLNILSSVRMLTLLNGHMREKDCVIKTYLHDGIQTRNIYIYIYIYIYIIYIYIYIERERERERERGDELR